MRPILALPVMLGLAALASAQQRSAPFDAPLVTLSIDGRYALVLDLDNDGFQDAVSWWWANAAGADRVRMRGWRNDQHGELVEVWNVTVETSLGSPASEYSTLRIFPCNVDSDGLTDFYLVLNSYGEGSVRVLRSGGLQQPEVEAAYSVDWSISGIPAEIHAVVEDFTGDGRADLAYSFTDTLWILEYVAGQPTLQLRSTTEPFGSFNNVNGLLSLDANGDSSPDLLAWRGSSLKLIALSGCVPTGTQTFTQGIVDDHMPAVGDVDRDGDQDVVIWDMSRYVLLRRTGPSAWSVEPPVTGGPAEFLVDVDLDGDLDGACCGGGGPNSIYNTEVSTLRVSINDGSGGFAPSIETSWLGSDHLAGITDLDHDGDLDVVAGRCILYARGPLTDVLHPPLGAPKTERSTGDIDGDSDPDFDLGLRPIERNLGEGLSSAHTPGFPAAPFGTSFIGPGWPGDFDGDGDLDLVVRHVVGSTLLAQRLLVNSGGGSFVDAGDAGQGSTSFNPGVASTPESSLVEDADGDGDSDLITWVVSPPISRLWWNDGSGHFAAGPEFPGELVREVADLTGDELPELLSLTPTLGWRAGLGGGAFGSRNELPETVDAASRMVLADLDSDGDLDLAVPRPSWYVVLYWNDGSGQFAVETLFLIGFPATPAPRLWSADVNLDGQLDLLAQAGGTSLRNGITIVKRSADGTGWDSPLHQIVYQHNGTSGILRDAVLRDVDGDGDVDFTTDRLIRGGKHSQPEAGRRWQSAGGIAGTGGLVPTLGAEGPFRAGESAELRVRGGLGGASGLLTILWVEDGPPTRATGSQRTSSGERIVARIPFTLSGTPGESGAGTWTLPFTVQVNAIGRTRHYVAEIYDPAAPNGIARSNGLWIQYGY
jgi:hypothetical protein